MVQVRIVLLLTFCICIGTGACAASGWENLDIKNGETSDHTDASTNPTNLPDLSQGCPCVHFSGSSLGKYMKGITFCIPAGSEKYNDRPTFSNNEGQVLYFDSGDNTWDVADSIGASNIRMMVEDKASHPKDITSTWKVGDDYAFDGAPASFYTHGDSSIKVHCGKYKPLLSTAAITGIVIVIVLLTIIPAVVLRVYCIRKRRAAMGNGQFGFARMV